MKFDLSTKKKKETHTQTDIFSLLSSFSIFSMLGVDGKREMTKGINHQSDSNSCP